MTTFAKTIFCLVFFLAYTIQGVTGFAGNVFVMPVGTHLIGLSSSVAVLNALGVLACGFLAVLNLRAVDWRELGRICAIMLPCVALGIWLDTVIELRVLLRIYGAVIVGVALYNLLVREHRFLPAWGQVAVIAAAGVIQGMFVSGGALLVIYAVQRFRDKAAFKATLSMVWVVLNFAYALVSFGQGYFTSDVVMLVLICIPLAAAGTVLGNRIEKRVSQEAFLRVTYVLLLVVGVLLFATA